MAHLDSKQPSDPPAAALLAAHARSHPSAAPAETRCLLSDEDSAADGIDRPLSTRTLLSAAVCRSSLRPLLRDASRRYWLCLLLLSVAVVVLSVLLAVFVYKWHRRDYVFLTSDDFPVDWRCPPPLSTSPISPSRVLILAADDRPLPAIVTLPFDASVWPYYLLTHHMNARYAARHGYTHQRITAPMQHTTRLSSWAKLYHLRSTVDWAAFDYVIAVDSDAWFTRMPFALHDMLHCFAPDMLPLPSSQLPPQPPSSASSSASSSSSSASASSATATSAAATTASTATSTLQWSADAPLFLFSADFADNAAHMHDLNAGVFVMRATPAARALVEQWWQWGERDGYTHLQHEWPFEQGVLNELLVRNASIAPLIRRLPRNVIYGHAAAYISHVTSFWPGQTGWRGRRERLIMQDIVRTDVEEREREVPG